MTSEVPEWVAAEGNVTVYFLPAAANLAAITVAEFTAGVNLTPYMPTTYGGITGEQNKIEQTRMSLTESFEVLGKIKRSLAEATFTHLPQEDAAHVGNKVKTALASGSNGVVVIRYGVPAPTPPAAGDKYDAIRVTTGIQNKNIPTEEGAPLTVTQGFSTQGALLEDGVIPS